MFMSSMLRVSFATAMSSMLGTERMARFASDKVCAANAADVIRDEVRVAIETSRYSFDSGGSPGSRKVVAHESQMNDAVSRSNSRARS